MARMHSRNGHAPYCSSAEAMSFWCETATAIAVRRTAEDMCEVSAPLGLDDLFALLLRPSRRFVVDKRQVYEERIAGKAWLSKWPRYRRAHELPLKPSLPNRRRQIACCKQGKYKI
ncbi:nucleotidyltransferase family protein [Pseudomonas sp. BIGb0427]|uniref:nucleotidyltransferase family protein n=1 Tax=unclassified Pseudomonas TaxID=196821 RepID=UPI00168F3081|nr:MULTISPECIES: nucleotidyltransferase family protein [unclassified Pseudomonas]NLU58630.1 nucleotidyltransferase family protein [Pseudomonas sp. BIGb0427]QPG63676.1 nucleotidyltransferase family protein [Pseudomonas sp. BIGb0427]